MTWPDWTGQTCVIVGTGPSAKDVPLELAKHKARFIVIKRSWMLAPWADVLYAIDRGWWIANNGAPEFKGLKIAASPSCARVYGLAHMRMKRGGDFAGFQAMHIAIGFGATKLILVGFDMTIENGAHWHDDYRGVGRPDRGRTEGWREALDGWAERFNALGVEVMNASIPSTLRSYPKVEFVSLWQSEPALIPLTATSRS